MTRSEFLRRVSVLLPVMTLVCGGLAATAAVAGGPVDGIAWADSLKDARARSYATGKPILVVFGAEWCGYCRKMEKTTLSQPQMAALINERFVPVHIDLTDQKSQTPAKRVASILKVKTLPTSVVLTAEADLLGRITGFQSPARLYEKLTAAEKAGAEIRVAGGTRAAE